MTTRRPTTAADREALLPPLRTHIAPGAKPAAQETAKQAYDRNVAEAIRRVGLLTARLNEAKTLGLGAAQPHWGNVGDMAELNSTLKQALHYAGCPEFTEK